MKIINNVTETVRDDLALTLNKSSKVSVAAACFSLYAFEELKSEMKGIEELRFIFNEPLFVDDSPVSGSSSGKNTTSHLRDLENSLYGTEYELRFKNNLNQKAIAKECAQWIREKVRFKANTSGTGIPGMMNVDGYTYAPFSEFSTVGLGRTKGNDAYNFTQKTEQNENASAYLNIFNELWNDKNTMQDVTDVVLKRLSAAYEENSPEYIYYFVLYNVFREFLTDVSADYLPDEAVGLKNSKIWHMLYDFQKDAVLGVINKLETYNGCLLADSVGLGKTFTALAVIKYYENKNKSVLVLCPKKLAENWNTFKEHYDNNPILEWLFERPRFKSYSMGVL